MTGVPTTGSQRRLGLVMGLALLVLAPVSAALWLDPAIPTSLESRELDLAVNVAATLVGAAVAILAWVRWRETASQAALFESAAFAALSVNNLVMVGFVLVGLPGQFGMDPDAPTTAPLYLTSMARLLAAVLLVLGALAGLRQWRLRLPPLLVAIGPAVIVLLGTAAVQAGATPFLREPLSGSGSGVSAAGPGLAFTVVQLVSATTFALAALLYLWLHGREAVVSRGFLAVGLVVAAFSQLHFAVEPVVAFGIVTSTDALRLVFYAILFLGIEAETQSDLRALRRANDELERLRDVEAASAALGERARLAREIHDGLAQDLWYAKLKQGRLVEAPALDDDARATARDVLQGIDAALAEARQAVMAMRAGDGGLSLEDVLRDYVEDFGDRFGIRTEFAAVGDLPQLPARSQAEVLRIVQEALNNVRKHADATLVRVRVERTDGSLAVVVSDNGRGFDPERVDRERFGLRSMQERAELIGGRFSVQSAASDGTRVRVDVPIGVLR